MIEVIAAIAGQDAALRRSTLLSADSAAARCDWQQNWAPSPQQAKPPASMASGA